MEIRGRIKSCTINDDVSMSIAAKILGISQSSIYKMAIAGHIPCRERRLSRIERFFKVSDLIQFGRDRGLILNASFVRNEDGTPYQA